MSPAAFILLRLGLLISVPVLYLISQALARADLPDPLPNLISGGIFLILLSSLFIRPAKRRQATLTVYCPGCDHPSGAQEYREALSNADGFYRCRGCGEILQHPLVK